MTDYAAEDTALRHRIYEAATDDLRTELAGIVTKGVAMLIAWELQRRGEGYRWPFKQVRQRSWNRA